MPRTPEAVLGALALREWALSALAGAGPSTVAPSASPGAWSLFLAVEQCALALSARRIPAGDVGAAAVRSYALTESRRVLGARGELRFMDGVARGLGLRLAVLKGAVPLVFGGEQFAMMDVDIAADSKDAAALAAALDEAGHHAHGRPASHRLAVRARERGAAVEIHTAVPGLDSHALARAQKVPGWALLAMHPADHVLHLLLHSAVQHNDRRGRVRDLLLIAEGLGRCRADDLGAVRAGLSREPQAEVLALQLEMAAALAAGAGKVADAFELMAAGSYLMQWTFSRWRLRGRAREFGWLAGSAAVARRSGSGSGLGAHTLDLPSAFGPLAWLRGRAPAAERAARLLFRRGKEWMLLPVGLSIAAGAGRAVRERSAARG